MSGIRLDKWLWAARFFKTRGLARTAIDGGHVHYNGVRAKPSKAVEVGARVVVTKGQTTFELDVLALDDQRKQASLAQLLYRETEESQKRREEIALRRKAMAAGIMAPSSRPNKRDRRALQKVQRQEDA